MERPEYDVLFRWLSASTMQPDDGWLLEYDIAAKFLEAALVQPKVKRLPSRDHFSADGTPMSLGP